MDCRHDFLPRKALAAIFAPIDTLKGLTPGCKGLFRGLSKA
jgi:hypothetical protein